MCFLGRSKIEGGRRGLGVEAMAGGDLLRERRNVPATPEPGDDEGNEDEPDVATPGDVSRGIPHHAKLLGE